MRNTGEAEHPPVALNLFGGTQRFLKAIGKLHCWLAISIVELAYEIYRIETAAAPRIAVAKIVGQQRAPTGAETDALFGKPFTLIEEVACLPKVGRRSAVANRPGKIGMQSQNRVHIE